MRGKSKGGFKVKVEMKEEVEVDIVYRDKKHWEIREG